MATSLAPRCYADPDVFAGERAAIWGREWIYVARATQLVRAGDYVAVDLCGWPVVVVAPEAGATPRAFLNVCRHRAGPLVHDGAGSCGSSLVCRYHGWSYDLDGRLHSARDFGAVVDPDTALAPVRCEVWRGLVFVNLDAGAPPLVQDLGEFATACEGFEIEACTEPRDVEDAVACNWKVYAENYLEGYHIPLVHPGLLREIDAKRYEVRVGDRWVEHIAPPRDGAATAGRWLWRWPNLALNLYPDGVNIERYLPDGVSRTRVLYTYLFPPGGDPLAHEASVKLSLELLEEDRTICEAVQRGLTSGAYEPGPLSPRHEAGVAAFQGWVGDAVPLAPKR